jgi:hypothetical protein
MGLAAQHGVAMMGHVVELTGEGVALAVGGYALVVAPACAGDEQHCWWGQVVKGWVGSLGWPC